MSIVTDLRRAITGSGEAPAVEVVRTLAATPAEVWDAIVDPARLARWLGRIEVAGRDAVVAPPIGTTFALRLDDDDPDDGAECTVLVCEPQRRVQLSWRWEGEPDSVVAVALEPHEAGTRLHLRHRLGDARLAADYGAGWEGHLALLADALAGLAPGGLDLASHATWMRMVDGALQVEQVVAAPRERVWLAFASADGLAAWWWRHWSDVTIEADVRVGGALRIEAPGAGILLEGEHLVVDEPEHLACTWRWTDADGTSRDEAYDVRLEALATEGGAAATRVVVRHTGPWSDDAPAESYRQGWTFVLGELASALAEATPSDRPAGTG